ncbi:hypothetical protein ScalyP_jg6208 [Parmales sp. scaly parma]|nr:hypothetical protein ScalyP_jg6208 [Parmales sp. scaly parma]
MPAPLSTIQLTPLRMNSEGTTTKSEGKPLIRIGLVGCGRIGLVHLAAIAKAQGVKVTMVSNPTISKAESAAAMYNVPEFTSDADEVITSPNVDAVWICSPSSLHASQIKLAAANKKDVFCEKPVATDLPETVEAINACEEAGVKLMIGLQRRFDPNFLRIKSGIEKKEIGETIVVKLCSRDPAPPPISYVKGGGGIFADMAVHDLDMGRFLIGDDPIEILAVGSTHIDKEILELEEPAERYDTASIIVKYPRGVMCHIDVCRQSSYGYDQRAEVLGTGGMLATENMYPNTAKLYTPSFTGNADLPFDFFLERYNDAYAKETVAFCDALVNDTPAPCTGKDGLVALVMSIAAAKSADEQRWVKFSEVVSSVYCTTPTSCAIVADSDIFPEGFKPTTDPADLLVVVTPPKQRIWERMFQ